MGSKGSQTTNTNQTQTYNPAGYGYIQNALNTAQNAAQLPFNIPQAPVAGFSGLQNQAFGQIGQSANLANSYYAQAGQLYGQAAQAPDVGAFYNPMASAVNAQLQNTFGMQNSQNTGQLTQAAGGIGADRIAVGQAQLANQQGLAQGQTDAQLYAQATQAAQAQQQAQMQAAAGLGNTGAGLQNAALSGGNALLGAGGLQQQLSQAQLNAPYQQQLAQAAFPYQQSQFLSGAVGALAPGLGGTTTGQGQTTSQYNPSIWGQIGGGLQALGGLGGYFGGSGSGKGSNPSAAGTPGSPYYGPVNAGGYAGGGEVSGQPIDVDQATLIPIGQIPHIQAHMPSLNLSAPQQSQQGNSNGLGQGIGTAVKLASMFMGSGGAVHRNPFADGGDVGDDTSPATFDQRFPMQLAGPQAMDAWRNGTPDHAMAFAATPPGGRPAAAAPAAADDAEEVRPTSHLPTVASPGIAPQGAAPSGPSLAGFLQSPWAALTAGGLEAMRTGSLASGFADTMKLASGQREAGQKDETIAQAAQRLQNEVKFHQDELNKPPTGYDYATDNTMQAIPGGPADPAVVSALTKAKVGSGLLEPETLDMLADSYIKGDHTVVSGLGYGAAGAQNRAALLNAIQKKAGPGADLTAAKIDLIGQTAGARVAGNREGNLKIILNATNAAVPAALEASKEVARTGWVPLDRIIQAGQVMTNDPKLASFGMANLQLAEHWARAMNPTGVMRESDRDKALGFLNTATSQSTYEVKVRQLQTQIARELAAVRGGGNTPGPGAAAPQFTGRTASGPGGAKLRETSDGQWVQ